MEAAKQRVDAPAAVDPDRDGERVGEVRERDDVNRRRLRLRPSGHALR